MPKFESEGLVLLKILGIHDGEQPSILGKIIKKGKPRIEIPIQDIISISNFTDAGYDNSLVKSGICLVLFPIVTIASFQNPLVPSFALFFWVCRLGHSSKEIRSIIWV